MFQGPVVGVHTLVQLGGEAVLGGQTVVHTEYWHPWHRARVRKLYVIDQDEAARWAGEGGAREAEREQEKLGLRGGRKAGPLRRGNSGYWRGCRRGTAGTAGTGVQLWGAGGAGGCGGYWRGLWWVLEGIVHEGTLSPHRAIST